MKTKQIFVNKKTGEKKLRDQAGISIIKVVADAGLDLDQVICVDQGVKYTRRDLILHPLFEKKLISGIQSNFNLARQKWKVPEWKTIHVRRHAGAKPDLEVVLSFNPKFNRQLAGYLPDNFKIVSKKKQEVEPEVVETKDDFPSLTPEKEQPEEESEKEDFPSLPAKKETVVFGNFDPVEVTEVAEVTEEAEEPQETVVFGNFGSVPVIEPVEEKAFTAFELLPEGSSWADF